MFRNVSKVSVIIPTYNRASYLERAVKSVLDQTFDKFELIVIDDGSNDDTGQVTERFGDTRIRYIRHGKRQGGASARNTGVKHARGEYIALLDDDDAWLPGKLEKQLEKFRALTNTNVGLVYCGYYVVADKNKRIFEEVKPIYRGKVTKELLKRNILGSPTPLIKRNCFESAGLFDEEFPSSQDHDCWIRISKYREFDFVPEPLAKFYVHGQQLSTDLDKQIKGREMLLGKHKDDFIKNPEILAMHLARLGKLCCLKKDSRKGRNYFRKSLVANPKTANTYLHWVLTIVAPKMQRFLLTRYGTHHLGKVMLY